MSKLALLGGEKAVTIKENETDCFKWPIVTEEDEAAVLEVIRAGKMSHSDITMEFEKEYCAWTGSKYAVGTNNGTSALLSAMYGCGVGKGDEIICPSITYWASCTSAYTLGATVVFADIDPYTLCLDPKKLESKITDKTKAIVVVHYCAYPADMDEIMAIARKHNVKVIEDVSHAQGGKYKGKMLGTIGDVGATSLMSEKSLAVGEAGILHTDNLEIYERAMSLGMYERMEAGNIQTPELRESAGLPRGGYKFRMHQVSSAMGRVQLKYYDERCEEITKAYMYFMELLEGVPGLKKRIPAADSGSTMGGWYAAKMLYNPDELGGLSITRFGEAVRAEGVLGLGGSVGCNLALHTHPLFNTVDVYNAGAPTRIANANKDVREMDNDLEVSKTIGKYTIMMPMFRKFDREVIEQCAAAFRKVAENYKDLLADDPGDPETLGGWHLIDHKKKK